jgi:hypothetical protein
MFATAVAPEPPPPTTVTVGADVYPLPPPVTNADPSVFTHAAVAPVPPPPVIDTVTSPPFPFAPGFKITIPVTTPFSTTARALAEAGAFVNVTVGVEV